MQRAEELFSDRHARLNSLYTIRDERGISVPFRMNAVQEKLYADLWLLNLVLKSRQHGVCVAPSTRVLTADLRWVAISDLRIGDELVAVDEHLPGGRGHRRMRTAVVQAALEVFEPAYRITFDDGRSVECTGPHPWLSRKVATDTKWRCIDAPNKGKLRVGTKVRWVTKPWDEPTVEDGWFGGMLDGEGSIGNGKGQARINVCQRYGPVWDRLNAYAADKGYHPSIEEDRRPRPSKFGTEPVPRLCFNRMDEMFRLIGQTRPTRFIGNRFWEGRELPGKKVGLGWATIVSIELLGPRPMVDLQTSAGTYIAEGFVSHNTTLIQLLMLDACLFNSNISAGIVAHNREDAEAFFEDKIKFAYDNLDPEIRKAIPATQDSAKSLTFANGSRIRVGTSLRSGTLQYLHVSEFGKVCAQFPAKAKEIVTGAFNTVHAGQFIAVESTAEGQGGYFHDMVMEALRHAEQKKSLTPLDFKLHFFPWFDDARCALSDADAATVTLTPNQEKYFDKLGIDLSHNQEAWYVKKLATQRDEMKREYPATVKEAFEASIEGAYYSREMSRMRMDGRICPIPVEGVPVDTFWDLGLNDDMVIWFRQRIGPEHRYIDYYSNSGEGMAFYARILQEKAQEREWTYGTHHMPHDARQRRLGKDAKSTEQHALECGIKPIYVALRIQAEQVGIEAMRAYLPKVWIDEKHCADGIKALDNYRKEWDEERAVFKDRPRHDWASHGAKGMETAAVTPEFYEDEEDERPLGDQGRSVAGGY